VRKTALVLVPLLVLVGGIFIGQGFGYIPGSFMTGSLSWAAVGIVMVVGGAGLLVAAARHGPSP
jgi:hypothetical protein